MKFAVALALFALIAAVGTVSGQLESAYPWTGIPATLLGLDSNVISVSVGGLSALTRYTISSQNAICKVWDASSNLYRPSTTFTTAAGQTSMTLNYKCALPSPVLQRANLVLSDGQGNPLVETDDIVVFLPLFLPILPQDANLCSTATAIGIQGLANITMPLTSNDGCTFYESCTLEDLADGNLVPITSITPAGTTISIYATCDANKAATISIDGVASQSFVVYPPPIFENFPTVIRGGDFYVTNGFQIQGMIPTESYILEPMHGNCSIWDDRTSDAFPNGHYVHELLIVNPPNGYWDVVFSCDGIEARTNMKLTRLVTGAYWFSPFFNVYFDNIASIIPTQYVNECSGKLHASGRLGDIMRFTSGLSNCAVYLDDQCATTPISDILQTSAAYKLPSSDGLDFWIKCKYYSSAQLLYLAAIPSNYYLVLTRPLITVPDPVHGAGNPGPSVQVDFIAPNIDYTLTTPDNNCWFWDGTEYQASIFIPASTTKPGPLISGPGWWMVCSFSNPTQTIILRGPDVDTVSVPFRVYVPSISPIPPRFYSDECQTVVVGDYLAGTTITPQDMYTHDEEDPSDSCQFFNDATGACDPATVMTPGASVTSQDGSPHTFGMMCAPGVHRQIRSGNGDANDMTYGAQSNPFLVMTRGDGKGGICGDPFFHGLDGRGFTFNGKADHWYNVYSNPWVTINSKFISAQTTKDATVNGAVGITTSHYNISVDNTDLDVTTERLNYQINGHKFHISPGQSLTLGSGCLSISFEKVAHTKIHHVLNIKTRQFTMHTYFLADHNQHVNTSYLDYFVSADQSHPETLGGVLGFTATGDYNISYFLHHDKHFVASGPFAHDSHADTYKGDKLCRLLNVRAMEEEEKSAEESVVEEKGEDLEAHLEAAHKRKHSATPCSYLPNLAECKNSIMCASKFCHPNLHICLTPGPCMTDDDCTANYGSCGDVGDSLPFLYTACMDDNGDLLADDETEVENVLAAAKAYDDAHHHVYVPKWKTTQAPLPQ